jgi:5-methyltetrahydropteroyltriglutamate--homocysteine methyltransferase
LKEVPEGKIAVLGLVSTKRPRVEKKEELMVRIREAARFLPLEQLAISPQCGFSTSIIGNRISVEEQKQKLHVLVETARDVWG